MIQHEPGYYVMRTHSGPTSDKVTYQLMSRRFSDRRSADSWADYIAYQTPKRHTVFVVEIPKQTPLQGET